MYHFVRNAWHISGPRFVSVTFVCQARSNKMRCGLNVPFLGTWLHFETGYVELTPAQCKVVASMPTSTVSTTPTQNSHFSEATLVETHM